MIAFLLFILYIIIAVSILNRISRNYRNYLSNRQIISAFIFKICFGIAYGLIFLKFYNGDDTWLYHDIAVSAYKDIREHPTHFFQFITDGGINTGNVFNIENSYWNHLEEELFIRLLVLFNIFSFGNYYVNVVLFCLLIFIGHLLLYRLFIQRFPYASFALKVAIFFIPAILFWLSGIRKDGMLFLAFSAALYYFHQLLYSRISIKNILLFTSSLLLAWLLRNFMVLCLLPALLAWLLCRLYRLPTLLCFTCVYIVAILCFFASNKIPSLPDLPLQVAQRQYSYLELKGNTRLPLDSLQPTIASYVKNLPQAVNHSFLRPYITESKSPLHLVSALDNLFFFCVLLLVILFPVRNIAALLKDPLVVTCLFCSVFGYIFIGYIVPFPGAIVRYKVVFELLFLCCFAVLLRPINDTLKN